MYFYAGVYKLIKDCTNNIKSRQAKTSRVNQQIRSEYPKLPRCRSDIGLQSHQLSLSRACFSDIISICRYFLCFHRIEHRQIVCLKYATFSKHKSLFFKSFSACNTYFIAFHNPLNDIEFGNLSVGSLNFPPN